MSNHKPSEDTMTNSSAMNALNVTGWAFAKEAEVISLACLDRLVTDVAGFHFSKSSGHAERMALVAT